MLDFQKELLYLWILTLNYTIMKKFYYVILSMIAIALVSCTSELDEINNTVHQQETLSGNELGANGGVTNSNPSYFMPASRTVEKYGLELY